MRIAGCRQVVLSESRDATEKRRVLRSFAVAIAWLAGAGVVAEPQQAAAGRVLKVGPDRMLTQPSEAARVAVEGDVIEIDAGVYVNDHAIWRADGLTIRGVGEGMAHLRSSGLIPNGKGIWIVQGDTMRIENIEFSGAAVVDSNGAAIRHEGGSLDIHNAFFHDNEFSVLSGDNPAAHIRVSDSRFWFQKRPRRFSHGIYIGAAGRFTLIGSHFKGTDQGHQVKSRALENLILYNRIEDTPEGNASRVIDLPNCGLSLIMGNDLHQAAGTGNLDVVGYGPEGCNDRNERERTLLVINNTLINDANGGAFVHNFSDAKVIVANNLVYGKGAFLTGEGETVSNVRHPLSPRGARSWSPPAVSPAVDGSAVIESTATQGLVVIPTSEFLPPVGRRARPRSGPVDVGSRELLR
ncbi:MAG: right-handed parallel beta-helix repeat-containing protein [Pseudomonadota bacterium]